MKKEKYKTNEMLKRWISKSIVIFSYVFSFEVEKEIKMWLREVPMNNKISRIDDPVTRIFINYKYCC